MPSSLAAADTFHCAWLRCCRSTAASSLRSAEISSAVSAGVSRRRVKTWSGRSSVPISGSLATAQAIANNAPIATRQAKRSIHYGMQMDLRSALFFEIDVYNKMVSTEDRLEGVRAFNEKRKPNFKGK